MKICRRCGESKPHDEFGPSARAKDGLKSWCRKCHTADQARRYHADIERSRRRTREYSRKRHKENAERENERYRRYYRDNPARRESSFAIHIRSRYGITTEEYGEMWEAQGGVCAICRKSQKSGHRLDVDHCHDTGRVRGLLCRACNQGIGRFSDDPVLLRAAIEYLESVRAH